MKKTLISCTLIGWSVIATAAILQGCNVTRVIKTESSYYQKGDTTITITTKTTETYDASKKN